MENEFSNRISEVIDIIKNSDEEIKNKIPESFMNFLEKNKSKDFIVKIDYTNKNWKQELKDETKGLLALIYRDYIVSGEEREELLKQEKEELNKIEQENRERYNPDNLFKKKTIIEENPEVKDLVVVTNIPWYKKLFEKIKNLFGRKNG